MEPKDRIIVALDTSDINDLRAPLKRLAPHVGWFKIGLELITSVGAERAIKLAKMYGAPETRIFFDGKFDDIPNTVAAASRNVVSRGVEMFDVHASAGPASIEAACANKGTAKVLAVTVLTSIDDPTSGMIFGNTPKYAVPNLARMALEAGADGIICSPQELPLLAELKCLKVTPGVRPKWASANDQKRVMTPAEAVRAGADYLVIGRPILKPPPEIGSPVEAARRIADEIADA